MNAFRVFAVIIPLFTSTPGRVIASSQESFAPPDIFSWSFADGTIDGTASFFPADEEVVADSTFPAAIDPTIVNSGRLHYAIGAAETPANLDRNRSFARECKFQGAPENALEHFFVRQWVKYGTPFDNSIQVARKTIYIRSNIDDNNGWFFIFGGYSGLDGLIFGAGGSGFPVAGHADPSTGIELSNLYLDDPYTLPWAPWRGIECEVLCNTPGNSDGRFQLWIYDTDRTVIRNQSWNNFNVRNSSTRKLELVQFGNQANRDTVGMVVDEYRHVNRLAISTQRLGP